jgi:hypothetical protein
VQGVLGSVLAGVCVFFIAKSSPGYIGLDAPPPEMLVFVFVAIAGFAGTKGLAFLRDRFIK